MLKRRKFLAATSLGVTALGVNVQATAKDKASDAWDNASAIVRSIKPPRIPSNSVNIVDFGADSSGNSDASAAIAKAIAAVTQQGGGRVLIPAGKFLTGPIHLESNINLHLDDAAHLVFSRSPKDYLPPVFTRWEGVELMGYSPLIYAYKKTNVAITGNGVLDGNADADHWWPWKGGRKKQNWNLIDGEDQKYAREKLFADAENNVRPEERVYADGSYLRPSFIEPYLCSNVLIEGVTIINSPFWLIHPVLCENVTIRGVTARSHGPNNDGCDPESCRNVLIENCFFDTGDDCIALKSGRNADGRRLNVPVENVVIRNCEMRDGHGGVVLGSEISGGARNIFVENCRMSSPELERAIRIKTNSRRGGTIEKFYIRNIDVGTVRDAVAINFHYEEGDSGTFDPMVKNIFIDNLRCEQARRAFYVRGFERAPIRNLSITDSVFDSVSQVSVIEHVERFLAKNVRINGKRFEVG